ncbi:hypothetical protein FCU94_18575 [Vibrio sp. JPW-9-11-11]|uniref:hypothetical protein n=1 Tax=Vibrio sp. JPW-9-11-11 TaxID=1416532 RepID=UPI0015938317|nr:hypothetical protein [Vibrio sp. JPW-9-11-11]NVD08857.1 hypothetical protein [Vibrio sp. JPW-9-11-11]
MKMFSQSKAALFGAALLFLSVGSFSLEGINNLQLSDHAHMACEVRTGSIELVITTQQTTPQGSKITITATSSMSSSLTPNSRLGLSLTGSAFPIQLALTHGTNTLIYTLDHHCRLERKPSEPIP